MFRNTGANAFAKNQMRLAYEDKRDLYCKCHNILQASINAQGKLMRRTTSQQKAHAVVISDIEAQYCLDLTPPMFRKA